MDEEKFMTLPKDPQKFASAWIDDWNRHDLKAILSHYSEEIEFHSPFIQKLLGNPSGILRGKKDLESYFLVGLKAYPDLCFEWIDTLVGSDSLVIYYRSVNGMRSAEFMRFDEKGQVDKAIAHYHSPLPT